MGIVIASTIMLLWGGHLYYSLSFVTVSITNPFVYLHILVQAYLYTGLFITGHDAMHGVIHTNKSVNIIFGYLSGFLFAGLSFPKLVKNHKLHHKYPATENDPDYSANSQNFFIWFGRFMGRYVTIIQLIIMAVLFNVLEYFFRLESVLLFWVVPAILGTLQLFYFGTYVPHKQPHTEDMNPHRSRTLQNNHLLAMLSCYFFGYHYEHHEHPLTPWWQLYRRKREMFG